LLDEVDQLVDPGDKVVNLLTEWLELQKLPYVLKPMAAPDSVFFRESCRTGQAAVVDPNPVAGQLKF
jgi:hypothetical protein